MSTRKSSGAREERHSESPSGATFPDTLWGTDYYLVTSGVVIPLEPGKSVVLGRDNEGCDVVLADARVSKRHAAVVPAAGRYFLEDLGSLNGTFVNGRRVEGRVALVAGDEILIRPYKLLFVGADHPEVVRSSRKIFLNHRPDSSGHLSGRLESFSILDLVQLLNATGQDGVLRIRDRRRTGELVFRGGEIIAATWGGAVAEEAVRQILSLESGSFDFLRVAPPEPITPLRVRTLGLILEAARRRDEMAAAEAPQPPASPRTRRIGQPDDSSRR